MELEDQSANAQIITPFEVTCQSPMTMKRDLNLKMDAYSKSIKLKLRRKGEPDAFLYFS